MKKALYFFCGDLDKDPVAPHILAAVREMYDPQPVPAGDGNAEGLCFDGKSVLRYSDDSGNQYDFAESDVVLSHGWSRYLPILKDQFSDYDFMGVVNWHEGANAPDSILTVHSIGDVPTGSYAPTDPVLYHNMLNALANAAAEYGLEGWTACTEATHWSGVLYDNDPTTIPEYRVPNYDIEIGSTPECWSNPDAARAVASALTHVFDSEERPKVLLAAGGIHFESAFSACGLYKEFPVMCAHILPNQWLVSGDYTGEGGADKLNAAIESVIGGIDGVSFHDNLAGPYKAVCRNAAEERGVPAFKHKVLRDENRTKETLA